MSTRMMRIAAVAIGSTLLVGKAVAGFPYSDRYEAWVQTHEFPIGAFSVALPSGDPEDRLEHYEAAGFTRLMTELSPEGQEDADYIDSTLDWTGIATNGLPEYPTAYQAQVVAGMAIGNGPSAFKVYDEPAPSVANFDIVADRIHWVQQNYQINYSVTPLVYANLTALETYNWLNSPANTTNEDFGSLYVNRADPDVLSYDRYPHLQPDPLDQFKPDEQNIYDDDKTYFHEMNIVRNWSLDYNIPMWMIQQATSRTSTNTNEHQYRLPSESDMRFQAFSFLAHGGLGIDYFMYRSPSFPEAIIDDSTGDPTSVYYAIQDMAPEIVNLGQTLPLLRPVGDVEFLGAASTEYDLVEVFEATSSRKLYNIEGAESALVSYFEDENGGEYFMVVNLDHGADLDKDEAEDTMTLFFDPAVTSVKRLNRFTGNIETLNTTNNPSGGNRYLILTLEGGTGDLFMYPSSNLFVTIPEPVSVGWLIMSAAIVCGRRGRSFFS